MREIRTHKLPQLTFVGQITTISSQATNTTFRLDDGTGLIDVKQWVDADKERETGKPVSKEGDFLRVWGRLKSFHDRRHVGAHLVRPITDFNEIHYHLLEATAVHLYFTRGPPGEINPVKGEGMFVGTADAAANGATNGGPKKLVDRLSGAGKKVYTLLQNAPQTNEGLHVHNIASQLGMPVSEVFKAGDELLGDGLIYTTADDETWAILEF